MTQTSCFHVHKFNFSYYSTDNDVLEDHELQGFANEVSSDGLGTNGGQGKVLIYHVLLFDTFA